MRQFILGLLALCVAIGFYFWRTGAAEETAVAVAAAPPAAAAPAEERFRTDPDSACRHIGRAPLDKSVTNVATMGIATEPLGGDRHKCRGEVTFDDRNGKHSKTRFEFTIQEDTSDDRWFVVETHAFEPVLD